MRLDREKGETRKERSNTGVWEGNTRKVGGRDDLIKKKELKQHWMNYFEWVQKRIQIFTIEDPLNIVFVINQIRSTVGEIFVLCNAISLSGTLPKAVFSLRVFFHLSFALGIHWSRCSSHRRIEAFRALNSIARLEYSRARTLSKSESLATNAAKM